MLHAPNSTEEKSIRRSRMEGDLSTQPRLGDNVNGPEIEEGVQVIANKLNNMVVSNTCLE